MTPTVTKTAASIKLHAWTPRKQRGPLKWPGGKQYLARRLLALAPTDITTYVEPFLGGGSLFLNLHCGVYQRALMVDVNPRVANLWTVLQSRQAFPLFYHDICNTPYTEATLLEHQENLSRDLGRIEWAISFMVINRMSRGGFGKTFAWSDRQRGGKPGDQNAWETAILELPAIHLKLQQHPTIICQGDGLPLLSSDIWCDDPKAFCYADPTYLPETLTCKHLYEHILTREQHVQMLESALKIKGRVMISGYHSTLYTEMLQGWRAYAFDIANHCGQGKVKQRRVECVWVNYTPPGLVELQQVA